MTATQPWATTVEQAPVARGNAPATAGFWLGLVGLVAGFVPILGLLVTVPAAVLSHAGRARFRSGRAAGPGRSTAGTVLGWTGSAICVLMSVFMIVAAANAPVQAVQPVAAAPVAPALLTVPNVVGMDDRQAREVLAAAGFSNVVLGPSTGSIAGVAAGTVTTQLPGVAALAAPGDPIVLGEAAAPPAPPAPVVAPQSAPTTAAAPAAQAPALVAEPDTDVDRPYVPAAPQPLVSSGSGSSSAYYANCSAARSAGAAPLYRGDAGYSSKLDRDGDGVACE
ncbi:hypothetical protein Ae168Ps1_3647c [Pseudonocardia sp. Ae168_Ps1]|uniref:excalibur calcium-binding domain-containing protein n=1 Tax=unclassified Pseudonocardia TaxID=2619320 RepID=UPI00094B2F6A|nr:MULTISPECIES: excalibur calcium-binding domain-containing protein [unclassified Pseudonocardia]OLL75247.1 hypothetical protein Ae150APs1_3625c [Pseudonocardia sp. Ae150A_Ps1]OLL81241.1 hypothetical protein Ae168Ps1_3647c [Pseudonocardia sp. Ae168_Ps1]OLL84644.1 hypothetical protein Ae263Ps1_1699 [Pseudonocardia sp. Ae263_Ps1]OLL95339.1 hypothetical protein Ae356Ps1_5236c [Pseudonocardia sp. Ae356_Ps1]